MQNSLEFKLGSCKRKNAEILSFLATLRKEKEYPVTEFESNLRNVQEKIENLLKACQIFAFFYQLWKWKLTVIFSFLQHPPLRDQPDGSCSLILDEFYPHLVGFDKQLQELKTKGTFFEVN